MIDDAYRDAMEPVMLAREQWIRSGSAADQARFDAAAAKFAKDYAARFDCSDCNTRGVCFCKPRTHVSSTPGVTDMSTKTDSIDVSIRKAAALIMNQTKLDEADASNRASALARYEQRRQSAIAYCKGDAAAEKAAVARLDASIAHEIELEQYRAQRNEQTKLDANTEQPLSPVVKAQVAYYDKVRSLHRTPSGGGFNGGDAA